MSQKSKKLSMRIIGFGIIFVAWTFLMSEIVKYEIETDYILTPRTSDSALEISQEVTSAPVDSDVVTTE